MIFFPPMCIIFLIFSKPPKLFLHAWYIRNKIICIQEKRRLMTTSRTNVNTLDTYTPTSYIKQILLPFIWYQTYGKGPYRERRNPLPSIHGILFAIISKGFFYMHHPTYKIAHTTAFVIRLGALAGMRY